MKDKTLFQYCPKLVVFNASGDSVLLARRRGEEDFNSTFSFIGGKMELDDKDIISGIKREKCEEIGIDAEVDVCPSLSWNEYYLKNNGQAMILPHHYAIYVGGKIDLNDEYSEYIWVPVDDLGTFEPKISTIEPAVLNILRLKALISRDDLIRI